MATRVEVRLRQKAKTRQCHRIKVNRMVRGYIKCVTAPIMVKVTVIVVDYH